MTNREYFNRTVKTLSDLTTSHALAAVYEEYTSHEKNVPEHVVTALKVLPTSDSLQFAIDTIRNNFVTVYQNLLFRYFTKFQHHDCDYTEECATYVCDIDKIVIDNGRGGYQVVDIANPDSYFHGVLELEPREDSTVYDYPELAMVGYILERENGSAMNYFAIN